ncbi:hypothetical protein [Leucobacter luti]|uniref:hypothetical protein n=1 Tax=Leucobacter luti TaxID=340320 RepID=UPI001C6937B7|nr:hypothetical protein [Leucobacter luti]QYM75985.1 hypothetical protein K1X41_00355 [Leucobacter luti]
MSVNGKIQHIAASDVSTLTDPYGVRGAPSYSAGYSAGLMKCATNSGEENAAHHHAHTHVGPGIS